MLIIDNENNFKKIAISNDKEVKKEFNEIYDNIKLKVKANQQTLRDKEFALEIKLPKNNSYYGLLGIKYSYYQNENLDVTININNRQSVIYTDSAFDNIAPLIIGLPIEYASGIIEALQEYEELKKIPQGK
ncbi:hypothetical protein [Gottschalkia acidurici]|nr:hypothetical protein [Gottschalkia acidurici]